MKYKLVVSDMDGTLLNSKSEISEENLKAIKRLNDLKIGFVIATGRLDTMVKAYLRQLENKNFVISCNGALVRNFFTGSTVYESPIKREEYLKLFDICRYYKVQFMAYGEYTLYSEKWNRRVEKFTRYNETICAEDRIKIDVADNICDILSEDEKVFKILVIEDDQEVLQKVKSEVDKIENLEACKSAINLLDIMNKNISKGNALKEMAEALNIKREEIIAFGDNYNDISMLKYAGFSVAMGNSEKVAKDCASYVTASNDEDGVAKALKLLIK